MWRHASKSNSARLARQVLAGAALLGGLLAAGSARAQACCAGASAIAPGRLELHERGLVGVQLRASTWLGSFDRAGHVHGPAGAAELDFEQAVWGSLRLLRRGQAGLFVPFLESWRRARTTGSELGGGLGDVNLNGRYDLTWGREYRYLPGIGLLVGVTLPTGRPPEAARLPLGSDATGIGTTQLSFGLAFEKPFGAWLVNLSGLVAKRATRHVQGLHSELAAQLSGILGVGVALSDQTSAAVVLTYLYEGNAKLDRREVAGSARRQLRFALATSYSASDTLRLQASLFLDPPLGGLGQNQSAMTGATFGLVRSFL